MKKLLPLFIFIFSLSVSEAKQSVRLHIDSAKIEIGEAVDLHFEKTLPKGNSLSTPYWDTLFLPLELLNHESGQKNKGADSVIFSHKLQLIAFDTGHHIILPVDFYVYDNNNRISDTIKSEAGLVSVYLAEIELEDGHRPIKDILNISWAIWDILFFLIGLLIILLALGFLVYYLQNRKRKPVKKVEPIIPQKPPYEEAIEMLTALRLKDYPAKGSFKLYFSELSYITRNYLEKRFEIDALELTTPEIISSFQRVTDEEKLQLSLASLLRTADFVKFAKGIPSVNDCDKVMDQAFYIVENTKPKEKKTDKKGEENQNQKEKNS
ncbi:MAG: hypothetical protein EA412_08625 [Chitinophagaceae bacterium]|nr:MAG: hypothetical protein EA412_08625 [Chitinophagaceae bacterium]